MGAKGLYQSVDADDPTSWVFSRYFNHSKVEVYAKLCQYNSIYVIDIYIYICIHTVYHVYTYLLKLQTSTGISHMFKYIFMNKSPCFNAMLV